VALIPRRAPLLSPLDRSFLGDWSGWYFDAPPIGHLLREAYPDRWLRIHSLPRSERMPTSGWHFAELRRRHVAVATDLLGDNAECALVLCVPSRDATSDRLASETRWGSVALSDLGQLDPELWHEETGVFAEPMSIRGAKTRWNAEAFYPFIDAVARDRIRGVLVELNRGQVYAPYDGGADLFFASTFERDSAQARLTSWLSPRPDGL